MYNISVYTYLYIYLMFGIQDLLWQRQCMPHVCVIDAVPTDEEIQQSLTALPKAPEVN